MAIHTFEGDLPAGMTMGWELFDDFSSLRALKGLETLSLHSTLKPGDLEGLDKLRTLGVQYISPDEVAALVRELHAIGNNANQIAYWANAQKSAAEPELRRAAALVYEAARLVKEQF